jgi:hypothetical protein
MEADVARTLHWFIEQESDCSSTQLQLSVQSSSFPVPVNVTLLKVLAPDSSPEQYCDNNMQAAVDSTITAHILGALRCNKCKMQTGANLRLCRLTDQEKSPLQQHMQE